ncbi:LacI family DNA-binding transcriptional regulator [Streptomyces mirabilis]|uniref:hypothetical protein n=1 Tax=Streptomyces mirabilis TaxID=68239 RepID=UPI002E284D27|nr:hypothetical protein [Streptomyces mirabilis]
MSVSNVINDLSDVRKETREKVLDAMARLDCRVNVAARNLRKARTGTIGLALPGARCVVWPTSGFGCRSRSK